MSEEWEALREAVRGLLAGYETRSAIEMPDGHDPALWQRLCTEVGVAGLAVPQEYGGAGATLLEAHVVLEELGRTLTPSPMLGCGVLATQALLFCSPAARARLLPGICAGDRIASVAWGGATPDAPVLLVAAGNTLYEADPAVVTRRPVESLDLTRRLVAVDFDGVPGRRLGPFDAAHLRDVACVALSAEQVGAASRALELTVSYVKERQQFGRPIGSFQALQHRLAHAYVRVEAARSASWTAAEALVAGAPEATRLAAAAKVWCSETEQAIAAEMVQMHGGIAITWEHDAHLHLRRAWASAHLFGSPAAHVTRLADALEASV